MRCEHKKCISDVLGTLDIEITLGNKPRFSLVRSQHISSFCMYSYTGSSSLGVSSVVFSVRGVLRDDLLAEVDKVKIFKTVESLQSHFILTMSHWSSGLPVCFPSQGTQVQIPRGVLMWNRDSPVSDVSLHW